MRVPKKEIIVSGIPGEIPKPAAAVLRSRLIGAVNALLDEVTVDELNLAVRLAIRGREETENLDEPACRASGTKGNREDLPTEERARQYEAHSPLFSFGHLILPESVREDILSAVEVIRFQSKVFEEWGLRKIEPFPRTSLNFHGPPGTGKTLAAHAMANYLCKPILVASYAEIESKYHGEGPKNVKAIFHAAERDAAVLFIDEADSLLSKRLLNVTQGSEQAINSMRSQIFICLEQFTGVVIFSTNLVENYDKAFETRVRHIEFPMPDEDCRREIWRIHLPEELPLGEDVSPQILASEVTDVCGRDIKNAVIDAAVRSARQGKDMVEQKDLLEAVERIRKARVNLRRRRPRPLTSEETEDVKDRLRSAIESGATAEKVTVDP